MLNLNSGLIGKLNFCCDAKLYLGNLVKGDETRIKLSATRYIDISSVDLKIPICWQTIHFIQKCYMNMTNVNTDLESNKRKRAKDQKLGKCFKETLDDYCQHTSLNGFQYVGDQSRPMRERILWLILCIISICCCGYSIYSVYTKWYDTPVIVSFAEKSTPVWHIPFPAVTICSEMKRPFKKGNPNTFATLLHQFSDTEDTFEPENVTDVEMDEFRALLHVCNTQLVPESTPLIQGEKLDYHEVLDRILPPLTRNLVFCDWLSNFDNCDAFFRKTLTDEGICYTYNGLAPTEIYRDITYQYQHYMEEENVTDVKESTWSLAKGYDASTGVESYPARVLSSGLRNAFQIFLQAAKGQYDFGCRGAVQGFKILLHSPDDVPHVSQQFLRIPMNHEVLISVKPNMITTSDGIAEYQPQRRQCFLSHERYLRYFKIYSQSNCQMECLANFTLAKCGCVKFSMPRSIDTPVCNENSIYCYTQAEQKLAVSEFDRNRNEDSLQNENESACNCLPACTSLIYDMEVSQAGVEFEKTLEAIGDTELTNEYPDAQMSWVSIYFKQSQFITSKRSEIYGFLEFLGNCGGIFGLFMGFSIMSLVEVIYYFPIRFCTNLRQSSKVNLQ